MGVSRIARIGSDGQRGHLGIASVVEEIHMCQVEKRVYVDRTENLKLTKEALDSIKLQFTIRSEDLGKLGKERTNR